jgi:hypothetical protein
MKYFVIAAVCTLAGFPAYGQPSKDSLTAASLYAICTHSVSDANTAKDHQELETICTTYFRGLTDALFVMQSLQDQGTRTCLPTNEAISIQNARVTFEGWLREHPNAAANSAGLVAAMSLVYAHKCGTGSN